MSIGTTAAVIGGLGLAGGLTSSIVGATTAKTAASDQEQSAQAAINEQAREFNTTQTNEAPWLQAGQGALTMLQAGLQPGGQFMTPADSEVYQTPTYNAPAPFSYGDFTAPTTVDETNDPGYQARLAAGQQALTRGALASGGAFSGGTMQALQQAGQSYASNEYQNVYNRALTGYQTNFGTALNSYNTNATTGLNAFDANTTAGLNAYNTRFNAANTNQSNQYNRLAALSGVGQTAVGQLATAGQAAANNTTSLLTQQGNAAAAGTLGVGSAVNSGIQNGLNAYQTGSILNMLQNGGAGGPATSTPLPGWSNDFYGPSQYGPIGLS